MQLSRCPPLRIRNGYRTEEKAGINHLAPKVNAILKEVCTKGYSMYPENDNQYKEYVITKVTKEAGGYVVTFDGGWCLYVEEYGAIPMKGNNIRLYGHDNRGVFINGVKVRYETEEENKRSIEAEIALKETTQKKKYWENKEKYDADIAALPEVFQRRIARFTETNPDFPWKYLEYELFCCKQAVVFAETVKDVAHFRNLPWEEQLAACPGMDSGHSGNTFGCACSLAEMYQRAPELVVKAHGALVYLVGCKEYGCHHS